MATLVQTFLSLADTYKRANPDGSVADIMEILNDQSQDIMRDWYMMECNDGTKHTHTIRTGLPSVSWGALYEGIPQSKSSAQQVSDTTGFIEAMSSVDQRLLNLADNRNLVRLTESAPFLESMAQEAVESIFYHNSATDARKPKGLASRFGAMGTSGISKQIVDAGGTGSDNTSIWFVTWGPHDFFGLYPKGTQAGITQIDRGVQRVTDLAGNPYYVEEEEFRQHLGFGLRDWRNCARVANIDVSELRAGNVDIYGFLLKAYYRLNRVRQTTTATTNQLSVGRTVMYVNREVMEAMDATATNRGSADNFVRLRPMEVEGKEILSYRGIPIRETDAILTTEGRVV